MGGIANMLLGQAAPSSALSGLSPEAQAALKALNGPGGVPETMPAAGPAPAPATMPSPAPSPAPASDPGFLGMLTQAFTNALSGILPSTQSMATQPTPPPLQSSGAGDAAIAAQKKREQGQQQQ